MQSSAPFLTPRPVLITAAVSAIASGGTRMLAKLAHAALQAARVRRLRNPRINLAKGFPTSCGGRPRRGTDVVFIQIACSGTYAVSLQVCSIDEPVLMKWNNSRISHFAKAGYSVQRRFRALLLRNELQRKSESMTRVSDSHFKHKYSVQANSRGFEEGPPPSTSWNYQRSRGLAPGGLIVGTSRYTTGPQSSFSCPAPIPHFRNRCKPSIVGIPRPDSSARHRLAFVILLLIFTRPGRMGRMEHQYQA